MSSPEIRSTDGVLLNHLESGDPRGRPVVLVAGFKAPATSWKPQLAALENAGYRVIALDRRGHGASEVGPDGAHTMERHGADIGDVIDALGLQDATVVGQSMGGNAIWALLAAGRVGGIRDIVIVDQTPKMLNSEDWAYGFYDYDAANAEHVLRDRHPRPEATLDRLEGTCAHRAAAEGDGPQGGEGGVHAGRARPC